MSTIACAAAAVIAKGGESTIVGASYPILTFWYYHLPNFVLAALMYTLLGRALLGLIVAPDSSNYIWRFFCRLTDPVVAVVALVDAEGGGPGGRSGCSASSGCSGCASGCSTSS